MKLVAEHLDCDIRKSVTALQYWISSGAKWTCATKNRKACGNSSSNRKQKNSAKKSNETRTDSVEELDLEGKIDILGEYYESKVRSPSLERRFRDMMDGEATRHDCCLECIMGVSNQTGVTEEMTHVLQVIYYIDFILIIGYFGLFSWVQVNNHHFFEWFLFKTVICPSGFKFRTVIFPKGFNSKRYFIRYANYMWKFWK